MNLGEKLNFEYTKYIEALNNGLTTYIKLKHIETNIVFVLLLNKDKRGIYYHPNTEERIEKELIISVGYNKIKRERIIRELNEDMFKLYKYCFL